MQAGARLATASGIDIFVDDAKTTDVEDAKDQPKYDGDVSGYSGSSGGCPGHLIFLN